MEEQEKLAGAMNRLAETLEQFLDPVVWQRVFRSAIDNQLINLPTVTVLPPIEEARARMVEANIQVQLTDEERERLTSDLFEAVKPQLNEFQGFVRQSISELPPRALKDAVEKLREGKKPSLRRRRGCIFLDFGEGEEFYLPL